MSVSLLSWSLLLFSISFVVFFFTWPQLIGQLSAVKMLFSLKPELVYSGKIHDKKKDQYRALGWCGDSGWPQNRHSQHLIQLPSAQLEFWWKTLFVNWSPEGQHSVFKNAKHIAINIYTAYVLYNICHVCLHLFTYTSFKVVSNCVQCVGGLCFSISPFGVLSWK